MSLFPQQQINQKTAPDVRPRTAQMVQNDDAYALTGEQRASGVPCGIMDQTVSALAPGHQHASHDPRTVISLGRFARPFVAHDFGEPFEPGEFAANFLVKRKGR